MIEEADETAYWLELIIEGELLPSSRIAPLLTETNEIVAIMVASRKTACNKQAAQQEPIIKNLKSKI